MKKNQSLRTYIVGVCMGIADLIPGVSGGTVALLGGIYETLINSISSVSGIFGSFRKQGITKKTIIDGRKTINGKFLIALFAGIATSILIGSRLIQRLLHEYPVYVAMFFVGLIIMSAIALYRNEGFMHDTKRTQINNIAYMLLGGLFGLSITVGSLGSLGTGSLGYFFAGVLGSMAMILPGISGSYILLIVGMYTNVLGKVSMFSEGLTSGNTAMMLAAIPDLFMVAIGVLTGLLVMSRVLKRFLAKRHKQTILVLLGCMIGALPAVFPGRGKIALALQGSIIAALAGALLIYGLLIKQRKKHS